MNFKSKFCEIYKIEPAGIAFCPYRVCPIGAHSDHQYGRWQAMSQGYIL